jgi:UDP-N-acetylmuramate dehydrogenase
VSAAAEAIAAAARALGSLAEADAPIGPLTTYRVGGPAALLVRVEDDAALGAVAAAVAASGVEVLVVGKGSNLLVADAGFPGLALVLGDAFAGVEIDGTSVRAGGAAARPVVARRTVGAGGGGVGWGGGGRGGVGGGVGL